MQAQLEFNVFQGAVCIDSVNGYAGTGYIGLDPIGSRIAPSSNIVDALTIAGRYGLREFNFLAPFTLSGVDLSSGYSFTADRIQTELTLAASANVSNCSAHDLTVNGEMDGFNLVSRARVSTIANVSGKIELCDLEADVGLTGDIQVNSCYSGIAAVGYPRITNIGTNEVIVRDMRGSLGLSGMTGGAHSVGVYGGRIVIEADCTGGSVYARGDPYDVVDLSGGAVNVVDQTDSHKVTEIWQDKGFDVDNPITVDETVGTITVAGIIRTWAGTVVKTLTRTP
jgi:hypothetical protein